jgi:UDPglucose--hexose-1-phosphate uridylyltransferase
VFAVYRDRLTRLKAEEKFRYVQIFKNVGPAAGASLEHVHSQLIALPGVPQVIQQELATSAEHFREHHTSLLCSTIERELAAKSRIVAQSPSFVAFCPYASRVPYELCVAPRRHSPRYEDAKVGELGELSRLMVDLIGRIERAVGVSAYNYLLHTQPFDMPAADHYHWHIEILPRLTKLAGFEWGTGCYINPYLPEAAAEHLRTA